MHRHRRPLSRDTRARNLNQSALPAARNIDCDPLPCHDDTGHSRQSDSSCHSNRRADHADSHAGRPSNADGGAPPTRIPPTAPQFSQSAEVTPTMPGIVECAPGQTIIINGVAAPYAPLLLSFGPRIVSGGSARASGDFAIPLIMGMERAGEYQVTVQVRGTNQIVRSLTCRVPPTTPTPAPRRLR